jgi:hypothetical protein
MPASGELKTPSREAQITSKQRHSLIEEIVNKRRQETDPRWVLHPAWESIEPYSHLIPMLGALESDPPLPDAIQNHLRKITAWQASSIDRSKVTGMKGFEEVWSDAENKVGVEMAQINSFPEDLRGVSRPWQKAFIDWQTIQTSGMQPLEP